MGDIKILTSEQMISVIETRKPLGIFYSEDKDLYIGIDNSSGDAWVEEFNTKNSCSNWLKGFPVKDAHGNWHNK